MAFHLPNGSHVFIEATSGAEMSATAITNANPAVFTIPTSGLEVGDVVRVADSTWGTLNNAVGRVLTVATDAVTIEGLDTSNVDIFPTGSGTATLVQVLTWDEIPQITTVAQDGNEQQFYSFQFLSDDRQRNLPTYKSAATYTFTFAHDFSMGIYSVLRAADESGDTRAMYMAVPRASEVRYWSAVPSFNDIPVTTINELEVVSVACSIQSQRMTFVPSATA